MGSQGCGGSPSWCRIDIGGQIDWHNAGVWVRSGECLNGGSDVHGLLALLRAWTVHHPAGSCKMGTDKDKMAVVDQELRVRGIEALRVVDASVMPDMPGGNINAPVIMMAEKASDIILGRKALAAEAA